MLIYFNEQAEQTEEKQAVYAINMAKAQANKDKNDTQSVFLIKQQKSFLYDPFDKFSNPRGVWLFKTVSEDVFVLYKMFLETQIRRYKTQAERKML